MVGRLGRQGTGLCRLLWGVEETGKRPFETRFRLLGLWGQRKRRCSCRMAARASLRARCCGRVGISPGSLLRSCGHLSGLVVAVVWASLRARCCGRVGISPGSLLRSCGHLSGLVVAVVWAFFCGLFICLSVCRMGLPPRARCCRRVGPFLWARCCRRVGLFLWARCCRQGRPLRVVCVCLSVVWASLRARCCRRSLLLRARCCGRVGRPSCSWALVSGLVTMSSIAMNRTGFKRTLFVLLLDSDRACCCPGCPLKLE